jgi:hypothetical protein
MNDETINQWLRSSPFQPFTLNLSNGESYEIRHPEKILVGKRQAVVYAPASDSFSFVALVHINSIRPIQPASQSTSQSAS